MCGMCDGSTRAAELRKMRDLVDRYGWALQFVEGDRVRSPWAYTVGLVRYGLPEFAVTGWEPERAGSLLNDTAHGAVCHDERWEPGRQFRLADDTRMEVVELSRPEVHLTTSALLFPEERLRALQLVWSDGRRRWPWSARFNDRRGGQPVLGPRSARGTYRKPSRS